MGKNLKTLLNIVLIILFTFLVSCSTTINKENNVIEADNNKIEDVQENSTTNDIFKKLDDIDKGLIIDEVKFGNVSYIIYKSEQDGLQKLYKKDENNNLKLFLEKNIIEIYENDSFFYVYYYSAKEEYRHNILLIDNFKNDMFKPCYKFNYSDYRFSKDNKYFAIVTGFYAMVFKGNNAIYNADISIDPKNSKNRRSQLFDALHIDISKEYSSAPNIYDYSMDFSDDNKTFFIHYSINNLSDIFLKINLDNKESHIYFFNDHGTHNDKNHKFNPNTGDVLYIASNIYPPFKQEKNNPNNYDFLEEDTDKIEYKYDETEKFLYLRNIYTQEMFVVDKIEPNNEKDYTFNFTKDNQIEINGEIINKYIKTIENLVYVECNSNKSSFIKKDSNVINNSLEIDKEVSSKVSSYIKENYNIDSEALLTLTFNNVSYVIITIPNFFIDFDNTYKKGDSTLELWKYEYDNCKRLIYNQTNLSIYNMVENNGYLMILGLKEHPGYIVKFNENKDTLYESKFQGFSKSPDGRYTLAYNRDNSFSVIEDDKLIISYDFNKNDDINTFWQNTIVELGQYWWDLEFNKLYIFISSGINPMYSIYCADLNTKEVKYYGSVKLHYFQMKDINKELSYICLDDSKLSLDFNPDRYCADLFTYKKFTNYLFNLRTNEKIYLANKAIYGYIEINNNLVKYTQATKHTYSNGEISGEPIKLTIDISPYIDENRVNYIKEIKKSIIENHNTSINEKNIELGLIFSSNKGNYQIVKINEIDDSFYYELWKIDDNKYEKIVDNTNAIFITNNQEYLCTVSKYGEFKIYDKNFDCIMNEKIYSENLLKRYNLESLEIGDYYVMKFDKNIFIAIKSDENLADIVNVDLVNKKISSIDYELNCNYDNYFINPENGYLVYQTGPSIVKHDELYNTKKASQFDLKESLIVINLITLEQEEISRDKLDFYVYH